MVMPTVSLHIFNMKIFKNIRISLLNNVSDLLHNVSDNVFEYQMLCLPKVFSHSHGFCSNAPGKLLNSLDSHIIGVPNKYPFDMKLRSLQLYF